MRVKLLEADTPIGEAEIYALDPPMCVAMAKLFPTLAYDQARHADVIDGDFIGDPGEVLRIEMQDGSTMKSGAISIQDWPSLDEREVHILGIYEPSFDELFSEHPDLKAYWGRG